MLTKLSRISFAVIALTILFTGLVSCGEESTAKTASAPGEEKKASDGTKVGEILKTEYFDVVVSNVRFAKSLKVSEFEELPEEAGNKYLVFELTLKNTDKESRMMFDGTVIVKANGQEYKYEDPEMVASEGWGILMDNINPLVTKKTKLAYKIPAELAGGTAYYNPARSDEDEVINLGEVK